MRLILTILLIGLLKAEGQIVINASAPYRPLSAPFVGLLDDYPNAVTAYSLRKLDKDYTGAAIRVRKDTTGQPEQDIGFTANGDLDTVSLKNFLNARSGFVVTWYNQADSSGIFGVRNATTSIQSYQPRIALLGVIERINNKVSIEGGASDFLQTPSNFTFTHAFTVGKINTYNTINYIAGSPTVGLWYGGSSTTAQGIGAFDGTNTRGITGEDFNQHLAWYSMRGGRLYVAKDGQVETNTGIFASSLSINRLFGRGTLGGVDFVGDIHELIFYNSDQTSNRTAIDTNINTYYGIY